MYMHIIYIICDTYIWYISMYLMSDCICQKSTWRPILKNCKNYKKNKAWYKHSHIHAHSHTCTHTQMRMFNKQKLIACIDVGRNRKNSTYNNKSRQVCWYDFHLRMGDGGIYIKKSKKLHARPPVRPSARHPF